MIKVSMRNGHYIITQQGAVILMTKAEFIKALRQAN